VFPHREARSTVLECQNCLHLEHSKHLLYTDNAAMEKEKCFVYCAGEGKDIELRHQRNPDVIFDAIDTAGGV